MLIRGRIRRVESLNPIKSGWPIGVGDGKRDPWTAESSCFLCSFAIQTDISILYNTMASIVPSRSALRYVAACLRASPSSSGGARATCSALRIDHDPQLPRARAQCTPTHGRTFTSCTTTHEQEPSQKTPRVKINISKNAIEQEYILDENIKTHMVQVRREDTSLNDPQTLRALLFTIDRDKQVVRQLASPPDRPAVVEITTRDALLDSLKQKATAQAIVAKQQKESKPKQIELNWAISSNDLALKKKQLRDFVEKGRKVEILLAAKKRQRKAEREEAENVIKELRDTIREIEGCRELKPLDGKIGGQALMTVGRVKS